MTADLRTTPMLFTGLRTSSVRHACAEDVVARGRLAALHQITTQMDHESRTATSVVPPCCIDFTNNGRKSVWLSTPLGESDVDRVVDVAVFGAWPCGPDHHCAAGRAGPRSGVTVLKRRAGLYTCPERRPFDDGQRASTAR